MAQVRTFYEVVSSYYDDGQVIAHLNGEVKATRKPRTMFFSGRKSDIYHDFFSSLQEAETFVKNAKFA